MQLKSLKVKYEEVDGLLNKIIENSTQKFWILNIHW